MSSTCILIRVRWGYAHFIATSIGIAYRSSCNAVEEWRERRESPCERLGRLALIVGARAVRRRVPQQQLDRLRRLVVARCEMQRRLAARSAHVRRCAAWEEERAHVRPVPEGRAVQRRPAVLRAPVDVGAVIQQQLHKHEFTFIDRQQNMRTKEMLECTVL